MHILYIYGIDDIIDFFFKIFEYICFEFYNLTKYAKWMEKIYSVLNGSYYLKAVYRMTIEIRNRNSHLPVSRVLCKCYLSINKHV